MLTALSGRQAGSHHLAVWRDTDKNRQCRTQDAAPPPPPPISHAANDVVELFFQLSFFSEEQTPANEICSHALLLTNVVRCFVCQVADMGEEERSFAVSEEDAAAAVAGGSSSGPGGIRATLVWMDPPATASSSVQLVHDLDLFLEGPDGTVWTM